MATALGDQAGAYKRNVYGRSKPNQTLIDRAEINKDDDDCTSGLRSRPRQSGGKRFLTFFLLLNFVQSQL